MAQYFEVHPDNPQPRLLKQAAALLHKGGVLAVPTGSGVASTSASMPCSMAARASGSARPGEAGCGGCRCRAWVVAL